MKIFLITVTLILCVLIAAIYFKKDAGYSEKTLLLLKNKFGYEKLNLEENIQHLAMGLKMMMI